MRRFGNNSLLLLAPDQVRVITLNANEALINYAKPIVAELRASMVRVEADFNATPIKAKIAHAEQGASTRCSSSAVATWKPAP